LQEPGESCDNQTIEASLDKDSHTIAPALKHRNFGSTIARDRAFKKLSLRRTGIKVASCIERYVIVVTPVRVRFAYFYMLFFTMQKGN
jgi:hypothetical protein